MDLLIRSPEVRRAVLIGIGTGYGDPSADLAGPVPDVVKHVTPMLLAGGRYDAENIVTLLDGEADKQTIIEAVAEMYAKTQAEDVALWMYSGHGSRVAGRELDGYDEVLCAAGCLSGGDFAAKCIRDDEVRLLADRAPRGARLAWWFDSCHSGDMTKFLSLPGLNPPRLIKSKFLPPPGYTPREFTFSARRVGQVATATRGEFLFSGCRDRETSADTWEDGGPCGAFTFHATRAKAAMPAGDATRLGDFHAAYVRRIRKANYTQNPQLETSVAERGCPISALF